MKRSLLVAGLLLLSASPTLGQSKPSFFIVHASSTDQAAKAGQASSEAEAAARALENFVGIALQDKYACARTLTDVEAGVLLGQQRLRELLGGSVSSEEMASVAASVGANQLVTVQVTQMGGRFIWYLVR